MKLKDINSIWKLEFKTLEELYNKVNQLTEEEKLAEVLGITQFEYYSSSPIKKDGYFLWLWYKKWVGDIK